jgi:hypothetical protein
MNIRQRVHIDDLNSRYRFLSNQTIGLPEGMKITIWQTGKMETFDRK